MRVIAPASTANLGPGFDCLGLALDLPFEIATADDPGLTERHLAVEHGHPAFVAYEAAGGDTGIELRWRSPIPPGRGLGFSGAARVAGAFMARVLRVGQAPESIEARQLVDDAFAIATDLEGHADNAAASAYGGFCVATPDGALRVDPPSGSFESVSVVVWSPSEGTSTRSARAKLPDSVPMSVAVGSIARSSTWVASVATGEFVAIRQACKDELHQPHRLDARPDSAAVLGSALEREAVLGAWLSGSGPSVAVLTGRDDAEGIAADLRLLGGGTVRALHVAGRGVHIGEPA